MTSRTLVLMRHAKAEGFADDDHGRRLTERGHRDAGAVGSWLAGRGLLPTHAMVSSAMRTRETWADLADASGTTAEPVFDDGLYAAGPDAALETLRTADPDAAVLAFVGHNPTVAYLAQTLTDPVTADAEAFRAISRDYPTAAVAVFEVEGDWADLAEGTARLTAFHSPQG